MWWGGHPGWWILGGLLSVAFWVALVILTINVVRGRPHHHHDHDWQAPGSSSALRLLEERYARGEISREEFLERRSVLTGGPPPAPPAGPMPPPA